jgi:hypothetical protein
LTSITPDFSSTPDHESDTCSSPTTGTNTASCTVTITQDSASSVTVTATAVWHFTDGTHSASVTRATDGTNGSNSGATARFVDANIAISPLSPVDVVGTAETFTVTVTALPAGTGSPTFAHPVISESPTPDTTSSSSCDQGTEQVSGNVLTCSVTINSSQAGTFTVQASDKVTMGGVQVTRITGDNAHGDSASAVETYVLPQPSIDSAVTDSPNSGTAQFQFSDTDTSVTFVCSLDGTNYSPCQDPGPGFGEQDYSGLAAGSYTFYVEATDGTNFSQPATHSWTTSGT